MTLDPTQAYRLLGLVPGATSDEVKTAYRDLAQVWHPDRFQDNERLRDKAMQNQQLINEAYAVLRDYQPRPSPVTAAPRTVGQRISATFGSRNLRHSLFTGVAMVRHSLNVLWPSATYARKPRRRKPPGAWIVLAIMALLAAALGLVALWWEGFLWF